MRKFILAAALAAIPLGGCVSAPMPITTMKQAVDATNLAEQGADLAIRTKKPSPATATMLNNIRGDVRAAMDSLYSDEQQGKALVYSTLDAALAALNAAVATQSSAASSAAS